MNFLQLCQSFVSEFGLSGGTGPVSVTGQVGELANAVRWIRAANLYVDNLYLDWKYLWSQYAETVESGDFDLPAPSDGTLVRLWDKTRLRYRRSGSTDTWEPLQHVDLAEFGRTYEPDTETSGSPAAFTILPNNTIRLSSPCDQAYDFRCDYWRRPTQLSDASDEPAMPADWHRIITARACVMYGAREDAPELITECAAEYADLLDKLEADQLEGFAYKRMSTDRAAR